MFLVVEFGLCCVCGVFSGRLGRPLFNRSVSRCVRPENGLLGRHQFFATAPRHHHSVRVETRNPHLIEPLDRDLFIQVRRILMINPKPFELFQIIKDLGA